MELAVRRKKGGREAKKKKVQEMAELARESKVIAISNLRNLPDSQLQRMRKVLRDKARIIVARNTLITRALEIAGRGKELISSIQGPNAIIFTEMDPFKLFKIMKENRGRAAAKPGQVAPFDIVVEAGDTTLPPGPVLTELKQAGITAMIKDGKVVIAKDSVVAKAGERISPMAAKVLQKLDIKPFEVGMEITAAWEEGVLYPHDVLDINTEEYVRMIGRGYVDALNLSFNVVYPTKDNAELLLRKAVQDSRALALEASICERDVMDMLIAKAHAQASTLKARVG